MNSRDATYRCFDSEELLEVNDAFDTIYESNPMINDTMAADPITCYGSEHVNDGTTWAEQL